MHRFYVESVCAIGEETYLPSDEAAHCVQVMRMRQGDTVELFDGERACKAMLTRVSHGLAAAVVVSDAPLREPRAEVTLYQGIMKGGKFEHVVQQCSEIGVYAIQPLNCTRSIPVQKNDAMEHSIARYRRIAREAAKLCGRAKIPEIHAYMDINDYALAARLQAHTRLIAPWELAEAGSIRDALSAVLSSDAPLSIGLVIGPEGGLTAEEISRLQDCGAHIVTLGKRILRAETAGVAALASILALSGDME